MKPAPAHLLVLALAIAGCRQETPPANPNAANAEKSDAGFLIGWLYGENRQLEDIPFPEVMRAASGHSVLPADASDPICQAMLEHIARAANQVIARMNADDAPIRGLSRINEASSHFEDALREALHTGEFSCEFPKTNQGQTQRSGYPDLAITHQPSGKIAYLDPKLFEVHSRDSSLRTFYFEPRERTGKVTRDACHFLLGIAHDGADGKWKFLSWDLVDLSQLKLQLKAEFQASNKDVYQPSSTLRTGHSP